jgi:CubicO group peptidase (beta-lactamase class C family)
MQRLSVFEAAAQEAVAGGGIPGVVGMAANAAELLYQGAFGAANAETGAPLKTDAVFFIASMTKAITSLAAVQLIEQGKIGLEQEAASILPEMKSHRVLGGFDAHGRPKLRPAARPITVRHLLTHTSGHSTDIWNPDTIRFIDVMNLPSMATCKTEALGTPLVFDPGDKWEYGISTDWVGKIVEAVSAKRLEEYFRDHIFGPIGMAETSFILSPAQRRKLVPVHGRNEGGGWKTLPFEVSQEPEFYMGGAGLYGPVGDYVKFLQMLLNRGRAAGGQVIKPETVDLLFANHIGAMEWPGMRTAIPAMSAEVDVMPGISKKWSLGFLRNEADVPGRRSAGSQFWGGLANSFFWVDPKKNLCGVAAFGYFPFADPACLDVFDALERDVYATFDRR